MLKWPEGIDIPLSAIGDLREDQLLLEAYGVPLAWCTTLPSVHRALVFWTDCDHIQKIDRHYVYVFRDTRFDWAMTQIVTKAALILPILEQADWIFVVDSYLSDGKPFKARKVHWADLDHSAMPTADARFEPPESDDATPSST